MSLARSRAFLRPTCTAALLAGFGLAGSALAGGVPPEVLALTGTDNTLGPDLGAGETFLDFDLPTISSLGHVAFNAATSQSGTMAAHLSGSGMNSVVFSAGSSAMGPSGSVTINDLLGVDASGFGAVAQNAAGSMVFRGNGGDALLYYDALTGSTHVLGQLGGMGDVTVPGVSDDAGFLGFDYASIALNDAGQVVYGAEIGIYDNSGALTGQRQAVMINNTDGSGRANSFVALDATDGTFGPQLGQDIVFNFFRGQTGLTDDGRVLLAAGLRGETLDAQDILEISTEGVFIVDPVAGTTVDLQRDQFFQDNSSPVNPVGPANGYEGYSPGLNWFASNAEGHFVVVGGGSRGTLEIAQNYDDRLMIATINLDGSNTNRQFAVAGTLDPTYGTPSGDSLFFGAAQNINLNRYLAALQVNANGDVLLAGHLMRQIPLNNPNGPFTFTRDGFGLILQDADAGENIVLAKTEDDGGLGPGLGDGVEFASFDTAALNNAGRVVFLAELTGTGIDSTNDQVLAYIPSSGEVVIALRSGDTFDVDPTAGLDERTIQSIFFAGSHADPTLFNGVHGIDNDGLNDASRAVVHLVFTDGSEAIVQIAVPEPGSAVALLVGALAVGRRRRRA